MSAYLIMKPLSLCLLQVEAGRWNGNLSLSNVEAQSLGLGRRTSQVYGRIEYNCVSRNRRRARATKSHASGRMFFTYLIVYSDTWKSNIHKPRRVRRSVILVHDGSIDHECLLISHNVRSNMSNIAREIIF